MALQLSGVLAILEPIKQPIKKAFGLDRRYLTNWMTDEFLELHARSKIHFTIKLSQTPRQNVNGVKLPSCAMTHWCNASDHSQFSYENALYYISCCSFFFFLSFCWVIHGNVGLVSKQRDSAFCVFYVAHAERRNERAGAEVGIKHVLEVPNLHSEFQHKD